MPVLESDIQSQSMLMEQVQRVMEHIRPYIQRNGGDIELVDVVGNRASIGLTFDDSVDEPRHVITSEAWPRSL